MYCVCGLVQKLSIRNDLSGSESMFKLGVLCKIKGMVGPPTHLHINPAVKTAHLIKIGTLFDRPSRVSPIQIINSLLSGFQAILVKF